MQKSQAGPLRAATADAVTLPSAALRKPFIKSEYWTNNSSRERAIWLMRQALWGAVVTENLCSARPAIPPLSSPQQADKYRTVLINLSHHTAFKLISNLVEIKANRFKSSQQFKKDFLIFFFLFGLRQVHCKLCPASESVCVCVFICTGRARWFTILFHLHQHS